MNNTALQGYAISQALNELEKFATEVDTLVDLVKAKIPKFFAQSTEYKLGEIEYSEEVAECGLFCNWKGLSVPVLKKKNKTNEEGYLFFQFSFYGDYVKNQLNSEYPQGMPLIHISFWDHPLEAEESAMAYPINPSDFEPNSLQLQSKNSLIVWESENSFEWTYSIPLLHIVASNIDELLLNPAYDLIHTNELTLTHQLEKSIISYLDIENIGNHNTR